jgi:hypothetical protein
MLPCCHAASQTGFAAGYHISCHFMSLVAYLDSDEDDGQDVQDEKDQHAQAPQQRSLKRRRDDASELPPLPAAFHDLYSTNARIGTRDDPALHGGRKRAVKHVDGNWPSHIYLECECCRYVQWVLGLTNATEGFLRL